jgi:hypothetical protein
MTMERQARCCGNPGAVLLLLLPYVVVAFEMYTGIPLVVWSHVLCVVS